ncbi:DBF4-type zinc finger-containing protein 2 [Balaenoptera musculus]|uniref:DBF4-type zinc finger-containing protein 2 n=1 Tax=Balaenoptera musculus TaxID=9771 RepID=A0A8B8XVH0_BALMU|nr:DBF4-type zinc finger-containing protein 2 [Balaenoptera musculus]XP_036713926.1 DBF4-type zinc finger-containing protein 2 [Balaenoptera musculus]XP_036713927.1 DBF4-type zinc finger-containing protein 2 [Balaenoptera musculus]
MQNRQGYCSYCCVHYNNLEQHISSDQHRYLTTQSRQWMGTTSLMERFLQDVLRHHPYHYQESRSVQNERLHMTTVSPSGVVPNDDFVPEIMTEDATGVREEMSSKAFEPVEELYSRPSKSQEYIQSVSIRPSVIQKLEKGQQQPLEFIHKIGSSMKEFNPVGIGHATNNRQNVICSSVISNAPVSCLPESSHERPVTTNATTGLPLGSHLDSVNKCDPNKVDKYFKQLDRGFRNPMLSSHPENSSVTYQKPKESNRKSLCINSDKLAIQEDVKSQGKTLSTGSKAHEFVGAEGSLKLESLSRLTVNPAVNLNKTDMPSNKGIFEDGIPKYHEKFFPNMDHTQEGKHLVYNKSAFLEQKISVSSEMKFAGGYLQSASDHHEEAVPDLWKEEQIDQEYKNCESRGSEMSFDGSSSFYSLTDQSKVTAKEINLLKEVRADLQYKNNKSCVSEISSDCDGSLQLTSNQTQVIVKDVSVQKAMHIRLVDESYESSDSEMNFDCDASLQSTDNYPQQPEKEVNLPKGAHVGLVDMNYGSSSSEISADSVFSLQSVVDQFPVAVTETKLWKKVHISLVDKNYGSSCSETSFDCDVSLQSVVDHPQLAVKERNLEDRLVYLKDKNRKPSSAKAHLDCDVSLQTMTDEPQRAVEEIYLLKEKNDVVDMNCGSHGSEMNFHLMKTDAQLVPDQSQVTVKEVNTQEVALDLENKSVKSSISDLSFDSHASLYPSANDQPQGACGEINLKALNVDMEVKSYGCSSSELSFDSDPPLMSVTELDVEEIRKKHINLEDESFESISSKITFDSDIPLHSVVDQSQVAIYEEESIDLGNKSNESCVSEITFDSDIPLHSGIYQPEVAAKETFIQKEEYIHLGGKDDERTASEISLDSYIPFHSVINHPEEAVKKLNPQKEEWAPLENKENEPCGSELSFDYDVFCSMTGCSEDPIKERNLKEEIIHLESKGNVPVVSESSMKSDISFHLVTDHPDIAIKEINQKEEHVNLADKGNELSVFETSLDSDIPLQSVIHKPEVVVKELWLQKEKHAKLKGKSAKFSGSEINLDSDYSMTEPQIAVKEIDVQKEEHVVLENKSDKYSGSEIILDSDVPLQSMNEKPQIAILKEDHVDPEDESTGPRGFEKNLGTDTPLHSVIDQPRLALLKEKHVDLADTNNESSDGKIAFHSDDPLQPLTEQFQEVVEKTNLWKEEDMGQKNKVDEPNASKLIHNSDVSLLSVSDQTEVAVKRINLKNEGHVYLEDKNSQYSGSEMSLNSDLLVQSIVDHPQITILEQEHTELEDKHNQSCGSEISFDSDDPLQSVANQLRETVKEVSLWKNEVDMEDKRDKSKCFEIVYDSDVLFQSVAGQTKVVKEINLWEEHVDLEDKVLKPSDSKINFVSDEPLQSVANEIQEAITEISLLREGHVCLGTKSYEPNDSEVIYVSNAHLQSVVEQPHILEEQQASLEDKSNDPCGPEISFVSDDPLQLVTSQLQKAVEEIGLWEEDHIYLEDKRYKLGDFEVSYDSDVDFIAGHSPVAVKEINLQEKDHDLHKNCELSVSEIKCDSGVHLRLEVDQPQVVCKEVNLQMEKHLGMEERVSDPSDSEMMCDSDVPLQIVINELQVSDKETNLQKMLFVDLMTSDNDCEMISDSDVPFQPVIDSPQMTVNEISCINAESFVPEDENCDSCDSELGYVCESSPQSVTNHSKKTFKVVNQKQDYIILEETSCEPYISELSFQMDASHQSTTSQSQEPGKKKAKYIDPEDKSRQSNRPKRNFEREETSQPVTQQRQKANKGVNLWKDVENIGLKDKNCESSVSAMDCNASPELVIHQMPDKENLLKLKHTDLESTSCEPCGSGMNFQCDPSLQSDNNQPQEAVNKIDLFEKMSFDLKETNHNSHSGSVPMVDSIRNLEKAEEVIEDDPDEPVLEGLPHVPPSFVGKTWSQIMREGDVKINALVKEFKKGRFHCYFDDDCETRKIKKKKSNEGKKITWTDLNQDTTSIQVLSDCDDNAGGISDIDDFSVALDKPSHYPSAKKHFEQTCQVASPCQAIKVSHGTQTNLASHPGTKRRITGQEKDSPVRKRLLLQNDRKTRKKVKIGKVEFPESCITVLKPLQPNALIYVLSSNIKLKKGESNNFSKRRHGSRNNWDLSIQYKFNQSSFNCYDPLNKQIVIDPSLNIEVPGPDRNNCVEIHFSHLNSNAGDDDTYVQSSASAPFMTVSVGHELMSHQEASESVFLEKSKILNSSEVSKQSNFQSTLLNHDVAKISLKSIGNKFLESKRKVQRRKVTTNNKSGFPKEGCRPVIPQQKTRIASEKRSIWIQTKLSDIIKKYIPKYSVFLRHKYRSRSTFVRMHLKKRKSDVSRLKKAKRPAKMLSKASVPSAGAEEQSKAIASSSPKQPVRGPSAVAGNKKNGNKKRPRRQRRKPSRPVRTYALRSSYSGIPYSDRMRTRLSNKS